MVDCRKGSILETEQGRVEIIRFLSLTSERVTGLPLLSVLVKDEGRDFDVVGTARFRHMPYPLDIAVNGDLALCEFIFTDTLRATCRHVVMGGEGMGWQWERVVFTLHPVGYDTATLMRKDVIAAHVRMTN